MRSPRAAALLLLVSLATSARAAADAQGCTVRRAAVDASGIATFVSECEWRIGFAFVERVFSDDELMAEANSNLGEGQDLGDGRSVNVYTPGRGVSDRQVTLENAREPLPGGGFRSRYWKSARQAPLAAGRVEVAIDEGVWEIAPAPGGGTRIRYEMRHDPGGSLAPWLVRRFQAPGIERSLDELRIAAERLAARATPSVASGPLTAAGAEARREGDAR
jgi:hypothetical protein